jgi:hypothetical protein
LLAASVREGTIRQRKTRETIPTSWNLRSTVNGAEAIPFIKRPSDLLPFQGED